MNQFNYILNRLAQIVLTFFLIMIVVFVLIRLLPGDPVTALLGERANEETIARLHAELGLDRPLSVQFLFFIKRFLNGNLGYSIVEGIPVVKLIANRMPITLLLTVYAPVLSLLLAVPLAFIAAIKRDTLIDTLIRGFFQIGLSSPVFYVGLILLIVFGAHLRWFPVGGVGNSLTENLYYLFLPALTLAFHQAAVLMRNLRSSIIDVLTAEYVDFAIAKGLPLRVVMASHVLRNALISTVTLFGLNIGWLISGAVITETVFAIPGAGRLMVDAIFARDYPVVQGLTLLLTLLVSFVFLATDIVQAWLDPRIHEER
jgi:peptide/nickel transport system permease protein